MNNEVMASRKYLVYSIDVDLSGKISIEREPENSHLDEILMWLSDDFDDDTKLILPKMKPGETHVLREGQHGNFESREIHFIKLKD